MRRAALLAVTVTVALVACKPQGNASADVKTAQTPAQTKQNAERTAVRTVAATSGTLTAVRTAGGTVAAVRDSTVAAEASGRVVRVEHAEGSLVRAGDVIVRLDDAAARDSLRDAQLALEAARINLRSGERQAPANTAQAQARVDAARIALSTAQRTEASNAALYAAGGLARVELEQSRQAVAGARAELEGAQAQLDKARQAPSGDLALLRVQVQQAENRVAQLQRELAKTALRAPFAGRVVEVTPQAGEFVTAGSKAFRIVGTDAPRVNFHVSPDDAARLQPGTAVTVVVNGQSTPAKIVRNAQVPGSTRLVAVSAALNVAGDTPIGAAAVVRYSVTLARGLIVPTGAVQVEGGQSHVFALDAGRAEQVRVSVLAEANGRVAVTGVAPGARVVYPVPAGLQPGAAVTPVKETP